MNEVAAAFLGGSCVLVGYVAGATHMLLARRLADRHEQNMRALAQHSPVRMVRIERTDGKTGSLRG